jgi:hypothetical protein
LTVFIKVSLFQAGSPPAGSGRIPNVDSLAFLQCAGMCLRIT